MAGFEVSTNGRFYPSTEGVDALLAPTPSLVLTAAGERYAKDT